MMPIRMCSPVEIHHRAAMVACPLCLPWIGKLASPEFLLAWQEQQSYPVLH
jgi:hypothetical protein